MPIHSPIAGIAIEIGLNIQFTILSLYIPPHQTFNVTDINNILNQISTPAIIVGDVNAWSNFWGSNNSNSRGQIFEDIILASDLVVLNDGSPTHFSTHHTFTHVDITLFSSVLSPKCEWAILDDLHGSDHYPIITKVFNCTNPSSSKHKPKFKTDAANWEKYKTIICH